MTAEEYINRLLNISTTKHGLLSDILDLTRTQTNTITEDGIEELGKIIARKQEKIDEINKLDEEFDVYFKRLKQLLNVKNLDELSGLKVEGVDKLQHIVKGIIDTVKEISLIEKQNRDKANALLNKLGEHLDTISKGKRMSSAYMQESVQTYSYFIDKKK
jgi:hypothetical protein